MSVHVRCIVSGSSCLHIALALKVDAGPALNTSKTAGARTSSCASAGCCRAQWCDAANRYQQWRRASRRRCMFRRKRERMDTVSRRTCPVVSMNHIQPRFVTSLPEVPLLTCQGGGSVNNGARHVKRDSTTWADCLLPQDPPTTMFHWQSSDQAECGNPPLVTKDGSNQWW